MQKLTENNALADQRGLVISYFGSSVAVCGDDGQVFQCHLRRNQDLPVVGDEVLWQRENSETGTITQILPRRSLLTRGDQHGKVRPIAANVDFILIVMTASAISSYLIDRYLLAAELMNIKPMIVLNKADLISHEAQEALQKQLLPYHHISYPIVLTSVVTKSGLDDLLTLLAKQTAVLVGPSGVGKSSIIAALTAGESIRIGEVSKKGAGKHTTTATRLYHLPQGAKLIDSPGVREFNLWKVDKSEVLRGFKEFIPYLKSCKFRDCQHLAEPGCAVKIAADSGEISRSRYESYEALMKEASKFKPIY